MQPFGDPGVETSQVEWAEMVAAQTRFASGFDGTEQTRAVCGDSLCPVPHWGFVVSGRIGVRFVDGREEFASAGESFYLPPGHALFTSEGAEVVDFSPAVTVAELMAKAQAMMARDEGLPIRSSSTPPL